MATVDLSSFKMRNTVGGWGLVRNNLIDAIEAILNTIVEDGSAFDAGAIPLAALDVDGSPVDGYVWVYNAALGKMQYAVNAPGDAGPVKMNVGDAAEYLDDKLGEGLKNDGADKLAVDLDTITAHLQYMGTI